MVMMHGCNIYKDFVIKGKGDCMSDCVDFKRIEYHQMTIYKTMAVGNEWIQKKICGLTVKAVMTLTMNL